MESHEIRLRGGWEWRPAGAGGEASSRLALPVRADSLPVGRLRLSRRFNRPPRVAGEPAMLRLSACPGIDSVSLNGRPIGPVSPDQPELEFRLEALQPRNELVIEAEPPRKVAEWGLISLIFFS